MLYGGWLVTSTTIAQPIVDDVDIVNASKELRRVLYQREELREQLRELQRDADQIKTRLKAVDEIVALQKQLDDLWSQIDKAKKVDNKPLFASLEQQAEQLELTIEHRRGLACRRAASPGRSTA